MGNDKVMHPENKNRETGVKQVKTSIVEGPTASPENSTPYNRSSSTDNKD